MSYSFNPFTGNLDKISVEDMSGYLPLSGGTMSGVIDMDDYALLNVDRLYLGSGMASDFIDDDTFTFNVDANAIASAESIKAYVDNKEHYISLQYSMSWSTKNNNWFTPSSTYGANYYNWNRDSGSTSLPAYWLDTYNPCIVVPVSGTIDSYHYYVTFTNSATYELALITGSPSYGDDGSPQVSGVGSSAQSQVATSNRYYDMGEDGLSTNVSKGDILIPFLRRTTDNTSTYYNGKGVLVINILV